MARHGKYRHSITIQEFVTPTGQNAYGEFVGGGWKTFVLRKAKIEQGNGSEILLQDELQGRQTWVIECPFVLNLKNTMRIIWAQPAETAGRIFNIDHFDGDSTMRREHTITCTELVDSST